MNWMRRTVSLVLVPNFEGDYIYGGDVTKWRKAVNVMQLKLL